MFIEKFYISSESKFKKINNKNEFISIFKEIYKPILKTDELAQLEENLNNCLDIDTINDEKFHDFVFNSIYFLITQSI